MPINAIVDSDSHGHCQRALVTAAVTNSRVILIRALAVESGESRRMSRNHIALSITLVTSLLALALAQGCGSSASDPAKDPAPPTMPSDVKVYVAVEDDGVVAVLRANDLSILGKIQLGDFKAHNVQVAPDGKTVWATLVANDTPANADAGHAHGGGGEVGAAEMDDEVVVIDPASDTVVARVALGAGVHPAHVVLSPDSRTAYVTGSGQNELIEIDAASRKIVRRTPLGHGAGAHGARVARDGKRVFVAEVDGKCVADVPASGGTPSHITLEGQAVQTAVSRDGKWLFASVYDTKKVARIDASTNAVTYVVLPAEAQGPVQLYPAPDGATLLVADQGILAGRPSSDRLYFVDIANGTVTGSLQVGHGAHGVVASENGRAFVTGIEDGTVTAIDLASKKVIGQVNVGMKPNGISVWTPQGGTP